MKAKNGRNVLLQSMRDFERTYYPNNQAHEKQNIINDDHDLGKNFAERTFLRIKKKYNIT